MPNHHFVPVVTFPILEIDVHCYVDVREWVLALGIISFVFCEMTHTDVRLLVARMCAFP